MTTPEDRPAESHAPRPEAAAATGRRAKILLVVSVFLMVFGSLLARMINTDGGSTSVTEVTIFGSGGYQISAYLYEPDSVSPAHPGPAVAMWHGLNNQKDYMDNTALELARRGFVVLSADMTGHGESDGANDGGGCGGPGTLAYLRGLSFVDTRNIGLVGMSQGGFCAATAAALSQPSGYRSIFYMESEPNQPGVPDTTPYLHLHNMAFNIGRFTEMGSMILVPKGNDAEVSPELLQLFGTKQPIMPKRVYGSISAGTARILYTPFEDHALSTDSGPAIHNAIDWMQRTLSGGESLSPSNQIWPWKVLGTGAALVGAFLFLFAMGGVLLRTRAFAGLARPVPEYRGLTGVNWWIGAVVTTAIGPLLYLWVWKHMFITPWMAANTLWPQTFTNVYMVWAVIVGLIAWAILAINHFAYTRRRGATLGNYGITEPDGHLDWRAIGRSAVLAVAILGPVYVVLDVIKGAWHVDFRAWVVTLMPMSEPRWIAFAHYLIPFAIFFVAQGIIFSGFLRWRSGKAPMWQEMLASSVILTLGALVWLLIFYVPLLTGDNSLFGGTNMLNITSAGLAGIYYIPLLVFWPVVACLYTYFFRKTGRVLLGPLIVTVLVVWALAASGDFGLWPIVG